MSTRFPRWFGLASVLVAALLARTALAQASPPSLSVVDEQGTECRISEAEIAKLPRTKAKVTDHENQTAEYEGVQLSELLQAQGVKLGKELRGGERVGAGGCRG